MRIQNRQHGGTILGIIIGLVIGLAIALVVALVITKTPMPFTNRLARPEKAQPLTPGQLTDPNKPLYGNRAPAKDAIQELLEQQGKRAQRNAAPPPADDRPPVIELSNNANRPARAAMPKPQAAQAAGAADGKWTYYLQAGAFRNKAEAENLRGKLALIGVEAHVSERESENGTLFRVRAGPFGQPEAMNQARSKLSENGVDAAVVRVAR